MDEFLAILHPAHVEYLRHFPLNSLNYLFEQLDQLDPEERDNYLGWAYLVIINPRKREPVTGKETMRELYVDEVSYEAFKQKCENILETGAVDQYMLAFLITSMTLHGLISIGDTTAINQKIDNTRDFVNYLRDKVEAGQGNNEQNLRLIAFEEEQIEALPARAQRNYAIYQSFCEKVVAKLLKERRR